MRAEHNSHSLIYRNPFGAVTNESEVVIRLALFDAGIPSYTKFVYIFDGKTYSQDMYFVFDTAGLCFYEAKIKIPNKTGLLHYWFEFGACDNIFYYGNNQENLGGIGSLYEQIPQNKYQITVYDKDFKTPDWWKESVCYQIFPDRFYRDGEFLGNRSDIIKRSWGDVPFYKAEQFGGKYLANDFFGGNLKGIEKKLPYLKELGITSIYLNPIFEAYSNHRYDTGNYEKIDETLGTEKDFLDLMNEAKKYGIRIILDGVFNHTGSDSKYFNKNGKYGSVGAYQSQDSPYYEWFNFINYPDEYESWWGIDTLPQVREDSESLREYLLTDENSIVKRWIKKGASGWRLDVVDELPDDFVKILRSAVKSENPDAVIIGEVWEDASNKVAYDKLREYFDGSELDSVMNYPLKNAMVDFALAKIDAVGFDRAIMSIKENYPKPAYYATLNFLSTHDTERILTVLSGKICDNKDEMATAILSFEERNRAKQLLKCLVAMQIMMPGVPTVFYGDEVGLEGYKDPFCRKCFPWGNEDTDIFEYYKKIIAVRNNGNEIKSGEFETIYKYKRCYGFIRYNDTAKTVVIINFGSDDKIRLDVARYGIKRLTEEDGKENKSDNGIFYIDIGENTAIILKA